MDLASLHLNSPCCCLQLRYWTKGDGREEGLHEGDVLVANHPQGAGGSHLPDITVMTPVFDKGKIVFFVASRWAIPADQMAPAALVSASAAYRQRVRWPEQVEAWRSGLCMTWQQALAPVCCRGHHQDVGGITPGSMPPNSRSLTEEGAAIIAFKLVRGGKFQVGLGLMTSETSACLLVQQLKMCPRLRPSCSACLALATGADLERLCPCRRRA